MMRVCADQNRKGQQRNTKPHHININGIEPYSGSHSIQSRTYFYLYRSMVGRLIVTSWHSATGAAGRPRRAGPCHNVEPFVGKDGRFSTGRHEAIRPRWWSRERWSNSIEGCDTSNDVAEVSPVSPRRVASGKLWPRMLLAFHHHIHSDSFLLSAHPRRRSHA